MEKIRSTFIRGNKTGLEGDELCRMCVKGITHPLKASNGEALPAPDAPKCIELIKQKQRELKSISVPTRMFHTQGDGTWGLRPGFSTSNPKLSRRIEHAEREKYNATCKLVRDEIEALKQYLYVKAIRIANNRNKDMHQAAEQLMPDIEEYEEGVICTIDRIQKSQERSLSSFPKLAILPNKDLPRRNQCRDFVAWSGDTRKTATDTFDQIKKKTITIPELIAKVEPLVPQIEIPGPIRKLLNSLLNSWEGLDLDDEKVNALGIKPEIVYVELASDKVRYRLSDFGIDGQAADSPRGEILKYALKRMVGGDPLVIQDFKPESLDKGIKAINGKYPKTKLESLRRYCNTAGYLGKSTTGPKSGAKKNRF